ncbi:hypothetical protein RN001_015333 [Aquatica leii]|uniref:Major facilitator superfamily (MFS) profile domain-containing protein n=1 Tax=Aquatica leii TaxID=1421715 RepID=A0AAN7PPI5_9COLE|nr:hypothetical protein RN001_015333 [Aquatica leii]
MEREWNFLMNKKRLYQYAASFSAMLITTCSGLHFGWTSPYMPVLLRKDSPIPMTNEQSSWVAVIYLIGGPCGATITGLTLDVFGRKSLLIASSLFFLISWLLLAFAHNLPGLLIARFIAGFSDGLIFATNPIYLAEIVEKQIRGCICSFIAIVYLIGILLINVMGNYLSIQQSSLVSATLPILFFMIFVWMPESPNYLLMKGDYDKAKKCLTLLRPVNEVNKELEDIAESIEEDASVKFPHLFTSKIYRKSLLVVIGLRGGQQLSGIVAFNFYAQTLFEETSDVISPLTSVIILYSVQILFSIASSLFVDKLGRRPLLIVSMLIVAIALLVEGAFFYLRDNSHVDVRHLGWLPIGGLFVFMASFSIGMQVIPLFIIGEIFPINIRAYGSAFSDVYYFLFAFIASKFFQVTKDEYGLYVPFFTFSVCSMLGLIVIVKFVPETKNKTLHEIQLELKNMK